MASSPIESFGEWNCIIINKYYLYAHQDVESNQWEDDEKSIVLIGNIYDPNAPKKNNEEILKDIHHRAFNVETLFRTVKQYAGRYVLIYKDNDSSVVFNDALGLREIYYCTIDNRVVCGSQPNLLAKYAEPDIGFSNDPDLLEFHNKIMTDSSWVGDETFYDGIKHLLPNHCFDLNKKDIFRYWPNESIKPLSLEEGVLNSCSFLKGTMESMANRHSLMVAVTAGWDSRTILAASRDIADRVYFFINDENLGYKHPDIAVPKKIFDSIGVPFHVHSVAKDVDNEFRRIFLDNVFLATERLLPTVYNVYFKNHSEKVNILGTGEIGRTRFGRDPKNLNSYRMTYKLGYKEGRYPLNQGKIILNELLPVARKFRINALTLLHCEQNKGNRFVVENSKSDIAIEEVDPFDSHMLFEVFLGVDKKYTKCRNNIFFKRMIRSMWPELLKWPINPPFTFKDKIYRCFEVIGVYESLKELQYQINYIKHLIKSRL